MAEKELETSYPQGDGKPDCPHCRGRGVVPVPPELLPPFAVGEITQPCGCVMVRDLIYNLERGWKSLSKAESIKTSPLCGKEGDNLWITGSTPKFKSHLKKVASRMGPRWNFVVVSDADLMDAWLSRGIEVIDPDIDQMRKAQVSGKFMALSDIAVPPELLIIRLGVKAARNAAMPEVFMEALLLREQESKPTWITDQPTCLLEDGHRAFNGQVEDFLEDWEHIVLERAKPKTVSNSTTGVQLLTLSDDAPEGEAEPEAEEDDDEFRPYEDHRLPEKKPKKHGPKGRKGGPK